MHEETILKARENLKQKKYSSTELTESVFKRIYRAEEKVQAFVHLTKDIALEQAREADRKIAEGEDGPLLGIPLAVKDLLCMENTRTTSSPLTTPPSSSG